MNDDDKPATKGDVQMAARLILIAQLWYFIFVMLTILVTHPKP